MFYTIDQNNSGGNFYQDSMVNHLVSVEANSAKEANEKLERITDHYNQNSCPCCGDYFSWWLDEGDGTDYISDGYGNNAFASVLDSFDRAYRRYIVVHYLNGEVITYDRTSFNSNHDGV